MVKCCELCERMFYGWDLFNNCCAAEKMQQLNYSIISIPPRIYLCSETVKSHNCAHRDSSTINNMYTMHTLRAVNLIISACAYAYESTMYHHAESQMCVKFITECGVVRKKSLIHTQHIL